MQDKPIICKLTSHPSAHILYIFNEMERYIGNVVSFIHEGLEKKEAILFVETKEIFEKVKIELKVKGLRPIDFQHLLFVDNTETYLTDNQFDLEKTSNLIHLLQPYFKEGKRIRTWGQVLLPEQGSSLEKLHIFECNNDAFISQSKLVSVCAYNGLITPAYVQNELMKTHSYIMTDTAYSLSPFYDREYIQILTEQEKEQFRKLEKQVQELRDKNNYLIKKNKLVIQSEQKLRTIINQLPIPVIIRRKAVILFLNEIAKEHFLMNNLNNKEKHHLHQFFEKYDKEASILDNTKIRQHQFILRNGKKKYYLVKSIEMVFEGEPSIFHSFVDISQQKENEGLILRSEKMKIAGELAASIAHELRNPLTAIIGFFHLLKGKGEENEWYYSIIEDELSRIEQISSELLTLAKPHSENRRKHNIVQLMEEVMFLLTSESNLKNIGLILQATSEEIFTKCESTKIKQVFINLIKNAMDSMESGGKIVLTVNKREENIEIQVIDQGHGIPKELLTRLGEPFYTTKEKGTGIGLMVCFQIIESHKGTIDVKSDVGLGTTFTITLPVWRDRVEV